MRNKISLALLLALFWVLNSGHNTALMITLGLGSIALVVFIAHCMDGVDQESQPLHLTTRIPSYWVWLLREVIVSNIDVVKRIWLGKDSISPVFFHLKANQKTDMGKVIYASSITLTPGTVTVNLEGDTLTVHALTLEAATQLQRGEMGQRVCRLEVED